MSARLIPTSEAYAELQRCFEHYNRELFDGGLPDCLITLQRKGKRIAGFFAPERFRRATGEVTHELALNPAHFATGGLVEILQTVAHEQTHLWQRVYGTPGRRGYHNKEWAAKMKAIGLQPSSTGKPGGKETGESIGDYVVDGGPFDVATKRLLDSGFVVSWAEVVDLVAASLEDGEGSGEATGDRSNRVKYQCPGCAANAWGKPDLALMCGKCRLDLARA